MRYLMVLLLVTCLAMQKARATNLRGRIVRYDAYSGRIFPLYNVRVDIWLWNGAQWVTPGYNFTDQNGFYVFPNLPPGYLFKIQVLNIVYPGQQAWTILNIAPPYFQDIPQIST